DLAKSFAHFLEQWRAHPFSTSFAVLRGEKNILQNRVDTTGAILDEAAIAYIANLAEDKDRWFHAWDLKGVSRGAGMEWEATRQKVLEAQGDQYLILKALAEWEESDSGRSGDVERLAGKKGAAFQFSDENADQKRAYEELVARDPSINAKRLAASGNIDQAL